MKKRIWELDAFRGICILAMILVHLVYDLTEIYGLIRWTTPIWFEALKQWGGVAFFLVSGICATLGSHPIKRGIIVFAGGMICTGVTTGLYLLGLGDRYMVIAFGALHCLGMCMVLWPLFRNWSGRRLLAGGLILSALGLSIIMVEPVENGLAFLGLANMRYISSDYFPLIRNLGFFLLGGGLGKTLYRERKSFFPRFEGRGKFFIWCGRHSLEIYLLHQPVLMAICVFLSYIFL